LKIRGHGIVHQDWDKVKETNQAIQDLLIDYEKLTIPTTAFITFEEEEGRLLAERVSKSDGRQIINQPLGLWK